jgi:PAS domain S-box-containing protein
MTHTTARLPDLLEPASDETCDALSTDPFRYARHRKFVLVTFCIFVPLHIVANVLNAFRVPYLPYRMVLEGTSVLGLVMAFAVIGWIHRTRVPSVICVVIIFLCLLSLVLDHPNVRASLSDLSGIPQRGILRGINNSVKDASGGLALVMMFWLLIDASEYAATAKQRGRSEAIQAAELEAVRAEIAERKRVEAELRDSEEKWRSTTENAPDHILLLNRDGTIRFINHTVSGVPPAKIVGTNILDHADPRFHESIRSCFDEVLSTGKPGKFELDYEGKGDCLRCYASRVGPVYCDGAIVGLTVSSRDISERKKMETELLEAKESYEHLYHYAQVGLYRTRISDGKLLACNEQLARIFGYADHEECCDLWTAKATYFDLEERSRLLKDLEVSPSFQDREFKVHHTDGSIGWVSLSARIYPDQGYLEGACADISQRKHAEEALQQAHDDLERQVEKRTSELRAANEQLREEVETRQQAERKFRDLLESAPDAMLITAPDGRMLLMNRQVSRVFGYTRNELTDQPIEVLIPKHSPSSETDSSIENPGGGNTPNPLWASESTGRRKDGSEFPAEIRQCTIATEEGPVGAVSIRDVTGRKELESSLRRSEKLASVGTLAAGIAHEINNPLGAILLCSEAARRWMTLPDGEAKLSDCLDEIKVETERCSRIVKNVQQFARRETSPKAPHDLLEIAETARDQVQRLCEHDPQFKDVEIDVSAESKLPRPIVNAMQMEQVFVNLLQNAVQASGPGTRVDMRISSNSDSLRISVTDEGRGMSEAEKTQAFDPFYTTKSPDRGTGLGLSIVHGLVTQHEGLLELESAPNKGTTITVVLPIRSAVVV